jgi:hypothetical protein
MHLRFYPFAEAFNKLFIGAGLEASYINVVINDGFSTSDSADNGIAGNFEILFGWKFLHSTGFFIEPSLGASLILGAKGIPYINGSIPIPDMPFDCDIGIEAEFRIGWAW